MKKILTFLFLAFITILSIQADDLTFYVEKVNSEYLCGRYRVLHSYKCPHLHDKDSYYLKDSITFDSQEDVIEYINSHKCVICNYCINNTAIYYHSSYNPIKQKVHTDIGKIRPIGFSSTIGYDYVYNNNYNATFHQMNASITLFGFFIEGVFGKGTNDFHTDMDDKYANTPTETEEHNAWLVHGSDIATHSYSSYESYEHKHYLSSYQVNFGYIVGINLSKYFEHHIYIGAFGGIAEFDGDEHYTFWSSWHTNCVGHWNNNGSHSEYGVNQVHKFNYGGIIGYAYKNLYIQAKIGRYSQGISIGYVLNIDDD